VKIEGAQLKDVAKIPRYVVDNDNHVFTMEDGKLARRKVDVLALQGNYAIIKKTSEHDMKIVTTILQKPLIGMDIKSINESIELKEELPEEDKSKQLSQTD
jgi:hypothetical protein